MSQSTLATLVPALGVLLKVTVLLGVAGLIVATLRHASAAARHLVWLLALGGTVVLAVITPVAPSLAIPVPALPVLRAALGAPGSTPTASAIDILSTTVEPRSGRANASFTSATAAAGGIDDVASNAFGDSRWLDSNAVTVPMVLVIAWLLGSIVVLAALHRCALNRIAARPRIVARNRARNGNSSFATPPNTPACVVAWP